jgi:hypothetical protein
MITANHVRNRMMQNAPDRFNRLPVEQLAKAGNDAWRAETIREIIRLSEPSNPAVFQRHLEGWKDSALNARLKTLQDESVRSFAGHRRDVPNHIAGLAAML